MAEGWTLGITAGARYLSWIPEVVASARNSLEDNGPRTQLEGETSFSGKLGLELTYSF